MNTKLSFGTDGIRGHADGHPFTSKALFDLGCAIATWAQQKYHNESPKILIGGDTRASFQRIKRDLLNGLLSHPSSVFDAGIISTPALYQLMHFDKSFNVGIVISASHNPYHDNGIKIFCSGSGKLSTPDEIEITMLYEKFAACDQVTLPLIGKHFLWASATREYKKNLQAMFPAGFLKGLTIALDCANGANSFIAADIFDSLGARVITISSSPNGYNINEHCGALYPAELQQTVYAYNADIGFAFDGDGDRVIAVSKHGAIKDGDDILFTLLTLPEYASQKAVIGTTMSNQGLEFGLQQIGKKLIRTHVGDKYVSAKMNEEQALLGGETSGHIIAQNYIPSSDGIFTALKVVQSLILNENFDFKTFEKMPQVIINVPVVVKKNLSEQPFVAIIKNQEEAIGSGRLLVRYSGTENILRVMAEAPAQEIAETVAQQLASQLQQALSQN